MNEKWFKDRKKGSKNYRKRKIDKRQKKDRKRKIEKKVEKKQKKR